MCAIPQVVILRVQCAARTLPHCYYSSVFVGIVPGLVDADGTWMVLRLSCKHQLGSKSSSLLLKPSLDRLACCSEYKKPT